jgi:hypothetical protein
MTTPTSGSQDEPALQLLHRWESLRHQITLAEQHGQPIELTDLLAELQLSEAAARALTYNRWPRVATLILTGGANSWTSITDALAMRTDEAYGHFAAWIADQQRLYRTTGQGLAPAEADRLDAVLAEVTW